MIPLCLFSGPISLDPFWGFRREGNSQWSSQSCQPQANLMRERVCGEALITPRAHSYLNHTLSAWRTAIPPPNKCSTALTMAHSSRIHLAYILNKVWTVTASRIPVLLFVFIPSCLIILCGQKVDMQPWLKGKTRERCSGRWKGSWCVTATGGRDGWMKQKGNQCGRPIYTQLLQLCNPSGYNGQGLKERPERGSKNKRVHLQR